MSYDNLTVERVDGVARVAIDSTSPLNGLNPTLLDELLDASAGLAEDDDVRCIALTAAGDAFCAGADLGALDGDADDAARLRVMASTLHDAIVQLHAARTPVAVGVNGVAAGAGFSLALVGDVVLVSDAARLEYAYPRIGLTGDGGSTFFLPRLVGLRRAKEIALLDEPIEPERAVELGLATEVVPADGLDGRLDALAERLASGPTIAYGETKRLLTGSFERGLGEQLAAETDAIARAARTEDYERGYAAFFGDGDPEFAGR